MLGCEALLGPGALRGAGGDNLVGDYGALLHHTALRGPLQFVSGGRCYTLVLGISPRYGFVRAPSSPKPRTVQRYGSLRFVTGGHCYFGLRRFSPLRFRYGSPPPIPGRLIDAVRRVEARSERLYIEHVPAQVYQCIWQEEILWRCWLEADRALHTRVWPRHCDVVGAVICTGRRD